jgi:hypothetical protein
MFKQNIFSLAFLVLFSFWGFSQEISLSSDQFIEGQYAPTTFSVEVSIEGVQAGEPAYLQVVNTETGYRKLKFGSNPNAIYSPKLNVMYGGNTELKITMKDSNANINWSKMKLRPEAKGSLVLAPYITAVGGLGNQWKTIHIPLSDFDTSIDFTQIAYMEFPYSAGAGAFELDISKVEFVGGSNPYLWFGEGKLDNIHDGNGSTYHMTAQVIDAVPVENNVNHVDLLIDGAVIGSDSQIPYQFNTEVQDSGLHLFSAKVYYHDATTATSENTEIYLNYYEPPSFSVSLNSPENASEYEQNESFNLEAQTEGASLNEPTYLHVTNTNTGYRKLKFGYDANYIYGPSKNVINGGNNNLQITLRTTDGFSNWSKIRLRPASSGSLNIGSYISEAGGSNGEWITINIPLADFSSSIDFTQLKYMEFPYSADAGFFTIDIQKIEFTGGTNPFLWFGETKTDNKHDGDGGSGQLVASLVESSITDETLEKVNFYVDDELIDEDLFSPFRMDYSIPDTGNYEIKAEAVLFNGLTATSNTRQIHIKTIANPVSPVQLSITKPTDGDSLLINDIQQIIPGYGGIDLELETYLKIWNTETGYRKLKLGYDDQYIYSGHADVIAGGNDTMEIVIKAFSSNIAWNRMRLRPSAKGLLTLDTYLPTYPNDWTTIKIPLNDFDSSIDFTDVSFMEFPYSADAGAFSIGVRSIRFIGGSNPFVWFDEHKNDNAHDGLGGGGQLFAEVITPDPEAVSILSASLFVDNSLIETINGLADHFNYSFIDHGDHQIFLKTLDSDSLEALSDTITITAYENDYSNFSEIIIEFAQTPTQLSIEKAALKYNKDFAYSLTLDDGKIDGYTYAYQFFNGGYIEDMGQSYPGLFSTDGCGHDIKFTAGIAWNSVSHSFNEIHINTPDYITWNEINEMYQGKWSILNHSYSHAAYGETDYQFQVVENNNVVLDKTGVKMRHFVIPSGDLDYIHFAFDANMYAVYSNKSQFNGYPSGIDIDPPFDTYQQKIYRRFLNDDNYDQSNIADKIDEIAQSSTNGNHKWFAEFTHRVRNTTTGGSLIFPTFEYYMNHIEQEYGKSGSDRVWVASLEDVYDYLLIRENTELNYTIEGNTAHVYLNFNNIPNDIREYFLSLNIDADQDIISVSPQFNSTTNFNVNKGLVNISWTPNTMKSMTVAGIENGDLQESKEGFQIYPNPISGHAFTVSVTSEHQALLQIQMIDILGKRVYQQALSIHSGNNDISIKDINLPSGIYFVRLIGEDAIEKKAIKIQIL